MANFIRQIIGGGVSFSASAIGWEAPTNDAPAFASFFDGNANNLAGSAASSIVGSPSFVAGTATDLPYLDTGSAASGINTGVAATPDMTVVALYRLPKASNVVGQTGNIVSNNTGSYTSGDPYELQSVVMTADEAYLHNFANTPAGGLICNVTGADSLFTSWCVVASRVNRSVLGQNEKVQILTGNLSGTVTVTNTAALTENGGPLFVGTDAAGGTNGASTGQFGFVGIWNSVLSDDDLEAMYALLQARAARYGVTV